MNGDFELGEWAVHPKLNTVVRNNTSRHVSPKAGEVLVFLARHQGDVVSKEDILAAVWEETFVTDDALTRCIGELRRVFEDDAREPSIIQTIAKRGYRLVPPVRWLGNGPSLNGGPDVGRPADTAGSIASVEEGPPVVCRRAPRHVSRGVTAAAASLTLVAGLVAGVAVMAWLRPVPVQALVKTTIDLEPGYVLASRNSRADIPTRTAIAISRDGTFVVYAAKPEGTTKTRLFLRRLNQTHATEIAGTEGALAPFLSPDDRRVGFAAGGQLKWVSIEGGPATVLGSSGAAPFGATWGADGSVVWSKGFDDGLHWVRSDPGSVELLTKRLPGEFQHRLPHFLPRGKGVLFTVAGRSMDPQPRTAVVDRDGRTHAVLDDAADARYVSTGHLVFVRRGLLMAVRFDLDRLRTIGHAMSVGINVAQALNEPASTEDTAAGQFAVSDAGALVYVAGGIAPDEQHSLVWVEQDGTEAGPAVPFTDAFMAARLSPDGRKVAYTVTGTKNRVWVLDLNSGGRTGLTDEGRVNFAIWMRNSQRVVFGGAISGPPNLYERPIDQSAPAQAITADNTWTGQGPGSFSRDGHLLAFWRQYPDSTQQILIRDQRSGEVTVFVQGRPGEMLMCPEFSPNGNWLAYVSNETGRHQVYVGAYPTGAKWPISSEGGTEPLWARDGKRLFYRANAEVWAVDLEEAAELRRGKPYRLFANAGKYVSANPGRAWDLSLDGRRFLMVRQEETKPQPVTRLVFVQNWTQQLQRLFDTPDRGQ